MTTIALSPTVFSKLSLVSSTVATAFLSKKGGQCTLDNHVRRPVRALAHRTAAFRLAGSGTRELARRARGARPVALADGGPRRAARAARRRRRNPALPGTSRPHLGRAGGLSKPGQRPLRGRAAEIAAAYLLVRLFAARNRGFLARACVGRRADLPGNLPRRPGAG